MLIRGKNQHNKQTNKKTSKSNPQTLASEMKQQVGIPVRLLMVVATLAGEDSSLNPAKLSASVRSLEIRFNSVTCACGALWDDLFKRISA